MSNSNDYYPQPIQWGKIIVGLILFFPIGFYFIFDEYRKKRSLWEYGNVLKKLAWVFVGFAFLTALMLTFFPLAYADGTVMIGWQQAILKVACALVYIGIGAAFYFSGVKKSGWQNPGRNVD